jgi:hypothetical protein
VTDRNRKGARLRGRIRDKQPAGAATATMAVQRLTRRHPRRPAKQSYGRRR